MIEVFRDVEVRDYGRGNGKNGHLRKNIAEFLSISFLKKFGVCEITL
jgi:hypothetical protein